MRAQGVLEVSTPALSQSATTDPHIDSLSASVCDRTRYLQTSPEFPMKRLLAAHKTSIYQLAKVFRNGELGSQHNTEFTLLEWYRVGFDHHQLMADVERLLVALFAMMGTHLSGSIKVSYVEAVAKLLNMDFDRIQVEDIESLFKNHGKSFPESVDELDAALDLTVDEFLLPTFEVDHLTFLIDYPADQASLARLSVNSQGVSIAERFEVYLGRIELANGFHELSDSAEQLKRFTADNTTRRLRGLPIMPIDYHLLDALSAGFPDCAGIALGLERLMMVLCGATHIEHVLSFGANNA